MSPPMTGRASEIAHIAGLLAAQQSVLLVGAAGVGKSRLAEAVGSSLDPEKWHLESIIGSPALAEIPFGCVSGLLQSEPATDRLTLLKDAQAEVFRRAGGRSVLVIVDDLDWVDPGTAALIESLPTAGAVVLATLRNPGLEAPSVAMAWKDQRLLRVDIGPLPEFDCTLLAAAMLAEVNAAADPAQVPVEVWRLSEGNPLYARELVLGGVHDRQIVIDDGHWVVSGSLGQSARVRDVVERRLDQLGSHERSTLVTLAATEPLSNRLAALLLDGGSLRALESASMVSRTGDPAVFTTSHPLIGEVVRATAGQSATQEAKSAFAEAVLNGPGVIPSAELLRAATWQLDVGQITASVALDAAGAAIASFEPLLARRFAEASAAQSGESAAYLLAGKAAALAGDLATSETALRRARDVATTDADIATAAAELSTTTGLMGRRPVEARAELELVFSELVDPSARVVAGMALLLMNTMCGHMSAVEILGSELLGLEMPPPVEAQALVFVTLAQSIGSRLELVDERIDRGLELAGQFPESLPLARLQFVLNRLFAYAADGRVLDALLDSTAERTALLASGGPGDVLSVGVAQVQTLHGGYADGIEHGRICSAFTDSFDPFDSLPILAGVMGVLEAQTGQVASAATRIAAYLEDDLVIAQSRMAVWLLRAKAWTLFEAGDASAASVAAEAGQMSFEAGLITWGAWAMHDAMLFGGVELVANDLASAAEDRSARMLLMMNDHAQALVKQSVVDCASAAQQFETAQAWPLAAATWVDVARLAAGQPSAARAAVRAETIWRAIPDFDTRTRRELDAPLTDREYEIAAAATFGSSSKDIAESLFLSTRTIDNHLQRVYGKLGVGRSELPELFAPPQIFSTPNLTSQSRASL